MDKEDAMGYYLVIEKWMNLENAMLREVSQSKKSKSHRCHLCEIPRVVNFTKSERRMADARNYEEGEVAEVGVES